MKRGIYLGFLAALTLCIMASFRPSAGSGNRYHAGESLIYKMYYNWNFVWLSAGEVTFEVKDEGNLYHIEVTGRTYSSYEWFYKVRDKYHSYIEKETGLPVLYIRDIHQGNYKHYEKIIFDRKQNKAISYTGKSAFDTKEHHIENIKDVYDMVSALYYLRNTDISRLKKEGTKSFSILLDNQKYDLSLFYKGDKFKEQLKEIGTYNTLQATAQLISGNAFKEGAQLKISISNDLNTLPLQMESPLSVGSVKAVLKSHKNLKYNLDSKVK
jgi:Protein of unknown function (DUF3108)